MTLVVGDWIHHRFYGASDVWVLANEAQAEIARRILKPQHILEVRRASECVNADRAEDEWIRIAAQNSRDAKVALLRFARWIVRHAPDDFRDHACARCDGTIVKDGFVCSFHQALDVIEIADAWLTER